jgi:hypothetical protein
MLQPRPQHQPETQHSPTVAHSPNGLYNSGTGANPLPQHNVNGVLPNGVVGGVGGGEGGVNGYHHY